MAYILCEFIDEADFHYLHKLLLRGLKKLVSDARASGYSIRNLAGFVREALAPHGRDSCWHQAVYLEKAHPEDRYGDIYVDSEKSKEVYRRWLEMTRPGPLENGLRRPEVSDHPYKPDREAYFLQE